MRNSEFETFVITCLSIRFNTFLIFTKSFHLCLSSSSSSECGAAGTHRVGGLVRVVIVVLLVGLHHNYVGHWKLCLLYLVSEGYCKGLFNSWGLCLLIISDCFNFSPLPIKPTQRALLRNKKLTFSPCSQY